MATLIMSLGLGYPGVHGPTSSGVHITFESMVPVDDYR